MIQFTRTALSFETDNWPYGRERCRCRFEIEHDKKRGQRMKRTTWNPTTGRENKPKFTRWCKYVCLAFDANDRTYILEYHSSGGICVMQSDMKNSVETVFDMQHSHVRYDQLIQLIQATGRSER